MCATTSVGESLHINEYEESAMSMDMYLKAEIDYRTARLTETMRRSRKVNRVRRPRTPAQKVA
jgi:hypothetical protein